MDQPANASGKTPTSAPQKVAIIGGGLGALSAALELTEPGSTAGRFEVTVYTIGWRLGGKGASGRNEAHHDRIEEHGLHLWFGFYQSAFRLMRSVMAEWRIPSSHPWNDPDPKKRWRHAFHPHSFCPVTEWHNNRWEIWPLTFPRRNNGAPGDPGGPSGDLPTMIKDLVKALLEMIREGAPWLGIGPGFMTPSDGLAVEALQFEASFEAWRTAASDTSFALVAGQEDALAHCSRLCHLADEALIQNSLVNARRLGIVLNLGFAIVHGLLSHSLDLRTKGLDALDRFELIAFLLDHHAAPAAVNSPLVGALYDGLFAFQAGEAKKPCLSAASGFRCLFNIFFNYREALNWKMQAGMGDTVFTPIYRVLEARGVKFHFFHRLKEIKLSADRKAVQSIRLRRQVTLRNAAAVYAPLREVNGLECWPSEPLWNQIDPDQAKKIRESGYNLEDPQNAWPDIDPNVDVQFGPGGFDWLVLGIPVKALQAVSGELAAANPKFKSMVEGLGTVCTQAFQAWLTRDLEALGWPGKYREGEKRERPILSNYWDPLNTWADMTHLLPREKCPPAVKNIAYFCGPLPDDLHGKEPDPEVRRYSTELLQELSTSLWPKTGGTNGKFDPGVIYMDYTRANRSISDRYTLSLPGTLKLRLRPGESGFANLILAGDWTRTGFDVGCIEATVRSGRQAAQAIHERVLGLAPQSSIRSELLD